MVKIDCFGFQYDTNLPINETWKRLEESEKIARQQCSDNGKNGIPKKNLIWELPRGNRQFDPCRTIGKDKEIRINDMDTKSIVIKVTQPWGWDQSVEGMNEQQKAFAMLRRSEQSFPVLKIVTFNRTSNAYRSYWSQVDADEIIFEGKCTPKGIVEELEK